MLILPTAFACDFWSAYFFEHFLSIFVLVFSGANVLVEKKLFVTRIVTLFAVEFSVLAVSLRSAYFFEHYMHFNAHKNMHLGGLEERRESP